MPEIHVCCAESPCQSVGFRVSTALSSANILVATKQDFKTANRKKFCCRIATDYYDAVIIGHSQFEKNPMGLERQYQMLEQQLDDIERGIDDIKASNGEQFTVK